MPPVKIAVIIPTYNRKKYLLLMLESLLKQEVNSTVKILIIVVVDGSKDGTFEVLKENYPQINLINGEGNLYYTRSINAGFIEARKFNPEYYLTLNDDIILPQDYINKIYNDINLMGNNCLMGSIAFTLSKPHQILFSGVSLHNLTFGKYHRYHKFLERVEPDDLHGVYESSEVTGRGMLIPAVILNDLKSFDNKLLQYGSDTEFCIRARKNGYKVFISWNAKIFGNEKLTGEGSKFKDLKDVNPWNVLFNKYSANSIYTAAYLLKKHNPFFLWPVSFSVLFISKIKYILKIFYKKLYN